jgi:glycosyltransferase involved in cell wall biosynthesis
MKIGIFDPYLDDIGGGERYMMTIAKCLAHDNEVDVFWDNKKDLEVLAERFLLDVSRLKLVKNIFNYSFIEKQKASRKYDLIIVLSDGSIPILFSKKLFLHMQQPIKHTLSVKEKLKLKRVNGIICNSEFTKKFIEENYGFKCRLLYPPVSIYGNKSEKENIILHVGRFRVMNVKTKDYKKQQIMINTFKQMIDEGLKDWKFLLAVSVNDLNDPSFLVMKKTAKDYPIEFLINSSVDDLWKRGGKAKIYWHATGFEEDLKKYPQLSEHFGISTVEAMGVGAVPIVFNGGGQKEIVTSFKNGFLWNSTDELKTFTIKLMEDKNLQSVMSKSAYERSLDFNEENFCKNVHEVLNV